MPGRLALRLDGRTLCVANDGAPLTAAGVAAMASLRASAKRPEPGAAAASVGHLGVGFTAVRAISDEITVVSTSGSIRFSQAETAAALASLGSDELDDEVARRAGQLPTLRLPWPTPGLAPPEEYSTEVRLLLRDDAEIAALAEMLGLGGERAAERAFELASDLLWALPGLAEVALPTTAVQRRDVPDESGIVELLTSGGGRRFRVHRSAGDLPAGLLAGRPVEERGRTGWFVTWIVPLDDDGTVRPVTPNAVGAPTPTAETIGVPARLVASLPVDEVRSRIATGPLAEFVVERAAVGYGELIRTLPAEQRLALIPAPGFPLGEWDALLRNRLTAELAHAEVLPGATGQSIRPAEAVVVPGIAGRAAASVAEALPGLIAWPQAAAQVEALRGLGVRVGTLDEVLSAVAMVARPAAFYLPLYDALADAPSDDLAGLPIPRSGGGTLIGARGVLLSAASEESPWAASVGLIPGLRVAAPGLAHPLLSRLGARAMDAETLLAAPELAREIGRRYDAFDAGEPSDERDDEQDFAALVLDLLAACGSVPPGAETALSRLLLTDDEGQVFPAAELLMPGAPLRAVLADDVDLPTVGADWVDRYGADVLDMLGVRTTVGVARFALPPGDDADLDAVDLWWEEAASKDHDAGPVAAADDAQEFTAITDLDLIADDAWPEALAMIASHAPAREALRRTVFGTSYSAWWLRRYALLDGRPPGRWRTDDATELSGLYDSVTGPRVGGLPADLQVEIGVLQTLLDAASEPTELLARWADPTRVLPAGRVPVVTAAVIDALANAADDEISLPATVRALGGAVIDAADAVVLDHPMFAQILDPDVLVAGGGDPSRVAELLDLPLASEELHWSVVDSESVATTLADIPGGHRCLDYLGRADVAGRPVVLTPTLEVQKVGRDLSEPSTPRRVGWWIDDDVLYLDGSAHGIARAIADLAGRWADRHLLQAIADGSAEDLAELGIDPGPPRYR